MLYYVYIVHSTVRATLMKISTIYERTQVTEVSGACHCEAVSVCKEFWRKHVSLEQEALYNLQRSEDTSVFSHRRRLFHFSPQI